MFIERKVDPTTGRIELWRCRWENTGSGSARKVFVDKLCDERKAESDADGALSEIAAICWADGRTMGNIAVVSPELLGQFPDRRGNNAILPCDFVEAGKFRHGAIRMWCRTHQSHWGTKADLQAFEQFGELKCSDHNQPMNYIVSPQIIDLEAHGEIGIWCSMPPALSSNEIEQRSPLIHVHIRNSAEDAKAIDKDFPAVSLIYNQKIGLFSNDEISRVNLTPPAAFEFVKALEQDRRMDCINCTACGFPHLDMGDFATTPHRKHFCGNCGRDSTWSKEPIVSTPLQPLHSRYSSAKAPVSPDRSLNIDDYKGCTYTVWASTPAIVWTAKRPEEYGIHVHIHDGERRVVDDTFGEVILKGEKLQRSVLIEKMMERTKV